MVARLFIVSVLVLSLSPGALGQSWTTKLTPKERAVWDAIWAGDAPKVKALVAGMDLNKPTSTGQPVLAWLCSSVLRGGKVADALLDAGA
ncbi:MAG TPA: hypothetical protein VMI31_15515, partial [Fimbriimonadaceae bacterium]|nr:hypothetical protein [Fimbriimonadaceae bacterium]